MSVGQYFKIINCSKAATFVFWILFFIGIRPLNAVQVYGISGTGASYTTAPTDDFGFSNVGQMFDSTDGFYTTGIYLGNGWMLSAYHEVRSSVPGSSGFRFGNVVLNGIAYGVNSATAVRITDPATHDPADLAMVQLATIPTDPNLKTLVVSGTSPKAGSNLVLMGNGINRGDTLKKWSATWIETTGDYTYSGYLYGNGQSMRWGTGSVSGTDTVNDGFGVTSFFYSLFQANDGSAMAAGGDSGGGVFYKEGTQWELSGIMLTIATDPNQPNNTSVVGDATYAADLAYYSSQIRSVADTHLGLVQYSTWIAHFFGAQSGDFTAPGGTPQNDGISNVLKYLCDINPASAMSATDRAALPVVGLVTVSGTPYLTLTYRQNKSLTGLTISVQTSPDLRNWSTVTPDSTQSIGTDPVAGDPMMKMELKTNGARKMFVRLQLTVL